MKKLLLILSGIMMITGIMAQVPQGITHQAVMRDSQNQPIVESPIGVRISILQGGVDGEAVYVETHNPISNTNGLITYVIGQGAVESGVFAEIDWTEGQYFLKTESDPTGGTDYIISGVTQFLSVPYAIHASTAETAQSAAVAENVLGSVSQNILPPKATATEAADIGESSAILNGIVNGEGFSTTVVFEWGTTTTYGNTITALQSPVTGSDDVDVHAELTGLQAATTYHYRIKATNAVNVVYSNNMTFTTDALAMYSLSLEVNPEGAGSVSGAGEYQAGAVVSISATANEGWLFVNWTDLDGNVVSEDTFNVIEMPAEDLTLVANFEEDEIIDPDPENIMLIHDVVAEAGEIIIIEIEVMNDEEFIGFSLDVPLPEGFTYIDGTAQLFRKTNHMFAFNVLPTNVAKIISFSVTNDAFTGNQGVIFSFDVQTPEISGEYSIPIVDPIIGNSDGGNIITESIDGLVTLVAPDTIFALTLIANPEEGGEVFGAGVYIFGEEVEVDAVANEGWLFVNWTDINGNTVSGEATYTFNMPEEDLTLIANFEFIMDYGELFLTGPSEVVVPGAGQNIYQYTVYVIDPFGGFTPLDDFTYSVIPAPGTPLAGIEIDSATGVLTVESDAFFIVPLIDIRATSNLNPAVFISKLAFISNTPTKYIVDLFIIGDGSVDINGDTYSEVYQELELSVDETYTFFAESALGWTFAGWEGDLTGIDNPQDVLMDDNKVIIVSFTEGQYTLTVNITGEGAVTTIPDLDFYNFGDLVLLEATAEPGWTFSHWIGDVADTESPSTNIVMTEDKLVEAVFTQDQYTLSVNIIGEGAVTQDPDQAFYAFGDIVELEAIAVDGWEFVEWTGDIAQIDNPESATAIITMPAENITLTANFQTTETLVVITVTVNPQGAGLILGSGFNSITGEGVYEIGDQVELTAMPNHGTNFSYWLEDGTILTNSPSIAFIATQDRDLIAVFDFGTYQVNLTAVPDIGGDVEVTNDGEFYWGELATISAFPADTYQFVNWTLASTGQIISTNHVHQFVVSQNWDIYGNFEVIPVCSLSFSFESDGSGGVKRAVDYPEGTEVSISAVHDQGYSFLHWEEGAEKYSFRQDAIVNMNKNKELVAYFQAEDKAFTCGDNITFTYRGDEVTYGTMLRNGLCWVDRNLGADPMPFVPADDATGNADTRLYGDLFQWGRIDDGHQVRTSSTTPGLVNQDVTGNGNFITVGSWHYDWRSPQNNALWQGEGGINNPCPKGWRVPTEAELNAERQSWGSNNSAGAYASALKWPVGGYRYHYGTLSLVGSYGLVWSSSVSGSDARLLHFSSGDALMYSYSRALGMSVRCVRSF